jgi:ubiquinone/menaquinone biosynthesis C-methylase UbiE
MGIEKQGSKPTGKTGYFIGKMMNVVHTRFYKKHYDKLLPDKPISILDIGCGGGRLINYLTRKNQNYKLYGLDHSEEMVLLANKVNKEAVRDGQVFIRCGSASQLPYENESMDIITANETIQFWPEISESFSEIYRTLKNDGCFIIINRYPTEGSKWWKIAKLKNKDDYNNAFQQAGFKKIDIDLKAMKGWIIANAIK